MTWSNLNGERIAFVGYFDDLGPNEAIESHSVFVYDKPSGADTDAYDLPVLVLTTIDSSCLQSH